MPAGSLHLAFSAASIGVIRSVGTSVVAVCRRHSATELRIVDAGTGAVTLTLSPGGVVRRLAYDQRRPMRFLVTVGVGTPGHDANSGQFHDQLPAPRSAPRTVRVQLRPEVMVVPGPNDRLFTIEAGAGFVSLSITSFTLPPSSQ